MQIIMKVVNGLFRVAPPLGNHFRKSLQNRFNTKKNLSFILSLFILFSFSIPLQFVRAITSPSYWTSREYTVCQVYNGSSDAGLKGHDYEYAHLPTSEWTEMVADLQSGNHMLRADLFNLPGTPLPLVVSLTYNSLNSAVDIGMGLGWISNLHTCVDEDGTTHDLTYVTGTGAKLVFDWDSNNSIYLNPPGFAGKAEELQGGGYKITPLGSGSLTFNSDGKLTEIKDRCGTGKQTVGYTDGRPTSLTDYLSNRAITLTWSEGGKLTAVTDPMSHAWGLTYDQGEDYLTELVKPGGTTVKALFEYTGPGNKMNSHTDFDENEYIIAYHSTGTYTGWLNLWSQPTSPTSPATTTFAYDSATGYSLKTTVTDGESHATDYYFGSSSEALEKVSMVVDTTELKTEIEYDTDGFVDTIQDSYGNETTLAYDAVNHLTSITYPLPDENGTAFVKQWVYDSATLDGLVTQYREKLTASVWAETNYEYEDNDASCKPSSITDPLENETTIDYNANGQPTSITQPTSATGYSTKTTTLTYDGSTKLLIRMTNPEGNDIAFTNNGNGIPSTIATYEGSYSTGTLMKNVTSTYSAMGQRTGTSDSVTSETTSTTYTNTGATLTTLSASGCETSYLYTTASGINAKDTWILKPSKPGLEVILPGDPRWGNGGLDQPLSAGSLLPPSLLSYRPNPSSFTNSQDHETTYIYFKDGSVSEVTNHLSQETTYEQDDFGRMGSVTDPFGKESAYEFNLNSQVTTVSETGKADVTFTYDDAWRMTQKVDPVRGTVNYDYNVAGFLTSDELGAYTYDRLGRKTLLSYTGGGTKSWDYNLDGNLSGTGDGSSSVSVDFDRSGNPTEWTGDQGNYTTYSYSGAEGSKILGLPSSTTGYGDIGSYAFTYTSRYWLDTFEDTSKTDQLYDYSWSSNKELTQLDAPNEMRTEQIFTTKMLDRIRVKKPTDPTYLLDTDSTFNGDDQISGYTVTVKEDGQNSFTETNTLTYDVNKKIGSLYYTSNNRTITFGYDANTGKLTSKTYSDLGMYSISYNANTGNLSSIAYPNNGGTEGYTYEQNSRGRLTEISYPDGLGEDTLTFSWNNKDQVTGLTFDDGTTETSYSLSYNGVGKLSTYTKSEDSMEVETWNFSYGPNGLEKATKIVDSETVITQDFTTDPMGRILSMTYEEEDAEEGVNGEYYFHYDNFGNTALLTDADGNRKYAVLSNACNGKPVSVWNPNSLSIVNQAQGITGAISLNVTSNLSILASSSSRVVVAGTYSNISVSSGTTYPVCYIGEGPGSASSSINGPCDHPCILRPNDTCHDIKRKIEDCLEINKGDIGAVDSKLLGPNGLCNRLHTCSDTLGKLLTKSSTTNCCFGVFAIWVPQCSDPDIGAYVGEGDEGKRHAYGDLEGINKALIVYKC